MAPRECAIDCRFRVYAHITFVIFFLGILVGYFVSVYATEYTPETDKITAYYGMFHPCILIDHYPMSVIAIVLLSAGIFVTLIWLFMNYMLIYLKGNLQHNVAAAFLLGFCVVMELLYVNVFTAGMYTVDDIGTTAETFELTANDEKKVAIHSFYYVLNLISTLIQMQMLTSTWENIIGMDRMTFKWHVFWILMWTVGSFAVLEGIAFMGAGIISGNMAWLDNPTSFIQSLVVWCNTKLLMSNWGWIPTKIFRYILPSDIGIRLKFSKTKEPGFSVVGSPEYLLEIALRLLFLLVVGTYMVEDPSSTKDAALAQYTTLLPLSNGFRTQPWNYLFAPCWLLICAFISLSVFLGCIRQSLENEGDIVTPHMWASRVVGGLFALSSLMCVMIVVPLWDKSAYIAICFLVSFIMWIPLTAGVNIRSIVYLVGMIVLAALSPFTTAWINLLLLVWAMLITVILPVREPVYMLIEDMAGPKLPVKGRFYPFLAKLYSGYNEYPADETAVENGKDEPEAVPLQEKASSPDQVDIVA